MWWGWINLAVAILMLSVKDFIFGGVKQTKYETGYIILIILIVLYSFL